MFFAVLIEVAPSSGTIIEYLGTYFVGVLFYSITAYIAARYVVGDVSLKPAFGVGFVTATAVVALIRYPIYVIIGTSLVVDFVAIHLSYRLQYKTTALVTIVHYTVTLLGALLITYSITLFATAPI
ncbi:MAG: hypothetical protein ABEI06_08160 [Halobacteriaceae archaeon]